MGGGTPPAPVCKALKFSEEEHAMERLKFLLVGLGSLAVGVVFLLLGVVSAQQAPQYPLDDKLANEPAPWTAPGKWGKRCN